MNAIILAAGLGSRLKELTKNKHKALFEIDGIPNIERTIKFLNESGVFDIYIVTGYLAENFNFLEEKYNVKLLHNELYKNYNNAYSLKVALEYFGDSFLIDADVVLLKNIFTKYNYSRYYTTTRKKSDKKEWVVKTHNNRIIGIEISNEVAPSLLGISFFNKEDGAIIKEQICNLTIDFFENSKLYYDDLIIKNLNKINVQNEYVENKFVGEIDDKTDLEEIKQKIKGLKCNI
ncbi:NTP transferase domain-containing protein [Campylobacter pinnipediorum]|uniref:NTP transferase domain-containing protein n=1 Tax=Campylobacter pinnipediorum TaxID=1965231 RepID=UPI00084D10D2|nr:NTP transferase domain-containing protein [Campylobacter pinnipediorum]AQW83609.1 phosphocholine cytidylyltransferase [Campylobacter pinnipediorum subsp. pinnipediorum]AQW85131.1 phosphocholine cytidylyltransferase [Campylobacter pinnipediorum subsp. pinnipediorum]